MNGAENKEVFSENLRYYMEKQNKDRNQVCNDLALKYTTFADWYNGNKYPRIDKIELLANYFGIQKSDLIEKHNREDENAKMIEIAKTALFSGKDKVTDKMWEEVLAFARYVESREAEKNNED